MRPATIGIQLAAPLLWLCFTAPANAQAPVSELKYAVIVTRHGVRSPTWTPERLNQYSAEAWPDWGVAPGILTKHGRELMTIMGGFYRAWFLQSRLLNTAGCTDTARTYFWADTDQRTLETARALAETILPGCEATVHSTPGGKSDPLFDPLEAGLVKQDPKLGLAAVKGRIGANLDAVTDLYRAAFENLTRVLNGSSKAARSIFEQPVTLSSSGASVSMSGPLNLASTLTEDLLLEYTDGMSGSRFGWGRLDAAGLQQIMVLHTAYADYMRRTPYLARVRGSNLLSHILRSLDQAVEAKPVKGALGTPGTALLVISGHDTNLSNLSGMLGLSWLLPSYQRDDTPPGGALVFSLWRSADGKFSVRLQFVAQTLDQMHDAAPLSLAHPPAMADVFLDGCGTAAEGYACEWPAFQKTVTAAIGAEYVER